METFLLFLFTTLVYTTCGIGVSVHFLPSKYKDRALARLLLVFGWPVILILAFIAMPFLYIIKGNVENW